MKLLLETLTHKKYFVPSPTWMMRQAGRYLPEYRDVRQQAGSFLDLVYNPSLAAEVTLQPIRRYGMDGAILFSDILIVPHALGQSLSFEEGEGPILNTEDLSQICLNHIDDKFSKIYETVSKVKIALDKNYPETTLIGFSGAPWTVACYMVQGRGKTGFPKMINMLEETPQNLTPLIDLLIESTVLYLKGQILAGCDVLQIFDSWAGLIQDKKRFEQFCIEPTKEIIQEVRKDFPNTPFIGFPRQVPLEWLEDYITKTEIDGLSVGEDISMKDIKTDIVLQGNLDNKILLSGGRPLRKAVQNICSEMSGRPYIFNLGHGILKETPPQHVQDVLDVVRQNI